LLSWDDLGFDTLKNRCLAQVLSLNKDIQRCILRIDIRMYLCHDHRMCATKFLTTNWCNPSRDAFSPVPGNTVRSGYRVLRGSSRGDLRSVDRNHVGHNAKSEDFSVKGLSPVKQLSLWWPSKYAAAKATPAVPAHPVQGTGTTGVRGHGMYERLLRERRRSPRSRVGLLKLAGRSLNTKSAITLYEEVRCLHTSYEVG